MPKTLLLLIALLLAAPARAADRVGDAGRAYTTATWVALSGGITAAAGVASFGLGLPLVVEGPDHTPPGTYGAGMVLYTGGYVALATAGGLLAGGSLAARRVLVRNTGLRVPAWPGAIAMGAWAGTVALAVVVPAATGARPPGWLTLATFTTTHALGALQLFVNRRAWRDRPDDVAPQGLTVSVVPQASRRHAGVTLIAAF